MKCIMKHFTILKKEEQAGNLFVIRPEVPLQVDRMEKDTAKTTKFIRARL